MVYRVHPLMPRGYHKLTFENNDQTPNPPPAAACGQAARSTIKAEIEASPVVVFSYTLAPSVQNGFKQKNSRSDMAAAILDKAGARLVQDGGYPCRPYHATTPTPPLPRSTNRPTAPPPSHHPADTRFKVVELGTECNEK